MKRVSFFILAIVMVAGCISSSSNNIGGIVIQEFRSDMDIIEVGDEFSMYARIKNVGDVEAKDVDFVLNIDDSLGCEKTCKMVSSMKGVDVENNIDGEIAYCTWKCKAKEEHKGIVYNPRLRIYYKYLSIASKKIMLMSRKELLRMKQGKETISLGEYKHTNSPLMIDIKSKSAVVRKSNMVEIPLTINVRNVGSGTACKENCKNKEEWYRVRIKVEGNGSASGCNKDVYLWDGKEGSVSCTLKVKGSELAEKYINVVAKYGYFIEGETTFKII